MRRTRSVTAAASHRTAARSGDTFAGFLSLPVDGVNHKDGSAFLSAGRSPRRNRRMDWSPLRGVLHALSQLT